VRQTLTGGLFDTGWVFVVVGLAVLAALAVVVVGVRVRTARGEPTVLAAIDALVLGGLLLAVASTLTFTLVPQPDGPGGAHSWNLVPFASTSRIAASSVDALVAVRILLGNVLLFVPVGFFVALYRRSSHPLRSALVASLGLSLVVEVTQAALPLGRVANVDDVILNVAGGLIGAIVALAVWGAVRHLRPVVVSIEA
jgi:glycopeptide antibiotics resistance protein